MEQAKELYRDRRGLPWLETLLQDLRYALRGVRKSPGFAFIAVLALALGIGASTLMFSVLDTVLLNPFPYKDTGRDVVIYIRDISQPGSDGRLDFVPDEFLAYQQQNHSFAEMSAVTDFDGRGMSVRYSDGGGTREYPGLQVTANMFHMLGVQPVLGRTTTAEDAKLGAPPVVLISYRFWKTQLGGDPNIVGKELTLDNQPRTVIGVMPPRFRIGDADFWAPYRWARTHSGGEPVFLNTLWQLKAGVSRQVAAADVQVIANRLARTYPKLYPRKFAVVAEPWADTVVGRFSGLMFSLMAAVLMLLLIACSNVANLLLARAVAREREIAIRAAIGASRARLVRQLLSESFVLAVAACAAGCACAYVGLKLVTGLLPPDFVPAESVVRISPAALLFALGLTVMTTLLCGLAPALHGSGGQLYNRLTSRSGGLRHGGLRSGLVIGEVALSLVLLVGTGLMVRSFLAVRSVELGFDPSHVLAGRVVLPPKRYDTAEQKKLFFSELLANLAALPGVRAAAEGSSVPPWGGIGVTLSVPGMQVYGSTESFVQLCSENFFRALGIRLLRGRLLSPEDIQGARPVAVVNETLVRSFFGKSDPIGRSLRPDEPPGAAAPQQLQIIGVVADARNRGLRVAPLPELFVPYTVTGLGDRGIVVKTSGDPHALMASVRRAIWTVDPDVALASDGSIEDDLQREAYSEPRFGVVLLASFGGLGLAFVAIGIFSVMAHSVSLQTHDIGVRMALGARQGDVLRMMLRKGLTLILIGIGLGEAASAVLTRLAASQIWGVSARDPTTFTGVVVVMIGIGLAACLWPARRATKVDPMEALRYE